MSGMDEIEFDRAFSEFLDNPVYDKANEYLFELTKTAFMAGWKAAMDSRSKAAADGPKK